MTAPTDVESRLCVGLIEHLSGLGVLTWSPDAPYPAAARAAFLAEWPTSPDSAAMFTPYLVLDDPSQAMSTIGVQVRTRARGILAVRSLAGDIFNALHGLTYVTLPGGVSISQCLRRSGSTMGQDNANRQLWVDNYYVDADAPSANRD